MGLTDNQKRLIRAVSENDMINAKKCAIACLAEDTTQKNAHFVKRYTEIIKNTPTLIELPADIQGLLIMEDVQTGFRNDRYCITASDQKEVDRIIRMKSACEKLSAIGIPYTNATLFYGESGTGKTLLGRYVAYKLKLPFCYVNFSHVLSSYMGNSAKNLNKIFNFVSGAPCVLMLDEIDCIATERSNTSGTGVDGEINRITIALIQELNKIHSEVVLLAATNRLDRVDSAIKRRFIVHEVRALNESERIKLLGMYNMTTGAFFSDSELKDLAKCKGNQSYLIRVFIEKLAERIV